MFAADFGLKKSGWLSAEPSPRPSPGVPGEGEMRERFKRIFSFSDLKLCRLRRRRVLYPQPAASMP